MVGTKETRGSQRPWFPVLFLQHPHSLHKYGACGVTGAHLAALALHSGTATGSATWQHVHVWAGLQPTNTHDHHLLVLCPKNTPSLPPASKSATAPPSPLHQPPRTTQPPSPPPQPPPPPPSPHLQRGEEARLNQSRLVVAHARGAVSGHAEVRVLVYGAGDEAAACTHKGGPEGGKGGERGNGVGEEAGREGKGRLREGEEREVQGRRMAGFRAGDRER